MVPGIFLHSNLPVMFPCQKIKKVLQNCFICCLDVCRLLETEEVKTLNNLQWMKKYLASYLSQDFVKPMFRLIKPVNLR
jgi:hypothetical protein